MKRALIAAARLLMTIGGTVGVLLAVTLVCGALVSSFGVTA